MKIILLLLSFLVFGDCFSQGIWTEKDETNLVKYGEKWNQISVPLNFISSGALKLKSQTGFVNYAKSKVASDFYDQEIATTPFGLKANPRSEFGIYSVGKSGLDFLRKRIFPLSEKGNVECVLFLLAHQYWSSVNGLSTSSLEYDGGKALELLERNIENKSNLRDTHIAKWAVLILMDRFEEARIELKKSIDNFSEQDLHNIQELINSSASLPIVDSKFVKYFGVNSSWAYNEAPKVIGSQRFGVLELVISNSGKSIIHLNHFGMKMCVDGNFLLDADDYKFHSDYCTRREINNFDLLPGYSSAISSGLNEKLDRYPLYMSRFYISKGMKANSLEQFCRKLIGSNEFNKLDDTYRSKVFNMCIESENVELAKTITRTQKVNVNYDLLFAKYYFNKKFGDAQNRISFNRKQFEITKADCDSLQKYVKMALRADKNGDAHFFAGVVVGNCNCFKVDDKLIWDLYGEAYNLGNNEVKVIYDDFISNPKSKVAQNVIRYFGQSPGSAWNGRIECERCKKMYYPKTNFTDQLFPLSLQNSSAIAPSLLNFETAFLTIQDDWTSGYWCSKNCSNQGGDEKRKQAEIAKIKYEKEMIPCAFCSKSFARNKMISIYEAPCYETTLVLYLNPFSEVQDVHKVCSRKCELGYSKYLCKKNGYDPIED